MPAFLALVAAAGIAAQAGQAAQPPPQPPATTVVGAEGKLVSLIFLRADAENVTRRVYDALLDRQPTGQEFAESVAELQLGHLPQQLAVIVAKAEFTDRVASLPAAQMLESFKLQLASRPQLGQVAGNPLMLTYLAILAGEDPSRELPAQRTEVYRRYVEEGESLAEPYLDLLRAGGSAPPAELASRLGFDIGDPAFWSAGIDAIGDLVDEAEQLAAQLD